MENLYIPVNIKIRYEFFNGYGMKELAITGIVTLTTAVIAFLINKITGNVTTPIFITIISAVTTITITTKDQLNLSIIDHTKNVLRFIKSQKIYRFRYKNGRSF